MVIAIQVTSDVTDMRRDITCLIQAHGMIYGMVAGVTYIEVTTL